MENNSTYIYTMNSRQQISSPQQSPQSSSSASNGKVYLSKLRTGNN